MRELPNNYQSFFVVKIGVQVQVANFNCVHVYVVYVPCDALIVIEIFG